MKVVRMLGGLANRMFQYSLHEYMKTLGYEVWVDNYYKPTKWKMEEIDWNRIFPNAHLCMPSKSKIFIYGGGYDIISKVRRKLGLTYHLYNSPSVFHIPTKGEIEKNSYFSGVFQNAKMVAQIEKEMKQKFMFLPFEDYQNIKISKQMSSCNSVAVHVRKGKDYLNNSGLGCACNMDYYDKAFEYIKNNVENPVFFVFTDNPIWVKEHFLALDYTLINHNPSIGWGNHFDMQLMSCAKHNIIANSTYSWWGAFLNANSNKIVIAPQQWFGPESKYFCYNNTTIPFNWLAL